MTMHCDFHKNEHDHYEWRSTSYGTFCRDAMQEIEKPIGSNAFNIGGSKTDNRIKHWQDIQSRVTTHDGQFLQGAAGRAYQQKWSKKMLGKDLSAPVNYNTPSYQKELAKTK